MPLLLLLFSLPLILLFAGAQPLGNPDPAGITVDEDALTRTQLGNLSMNGNLSDKDPATRRPIGNLSSLGYINNTDAAVRPIAANLSGDAFQCLQLPLVSPSVPPFSRGRGRNSTAKCKSRAVLSVIAAIFRNVTITTIPAGGRGRQLSPAIKEAEPLMVRPIVTDASLQDLAPSVNAAPETRTVLSVSHHVTISAQIATVESESLATLLTMPGSPTPLIESTTDLITVRPSMQADAPAATISSNDPITVRPSTQADAPAATISSNAFSVAAIEKVAAADSSAQKLVLSMPPLRLSPLSFGGSTYTGNTRSGFVVAGQALSPGSQITVSGTPVSLAPGGTAAVVGSSTQTLAPVTNPAQPLVTLFPPAILTLDGSTYTADSSSDFHISGQTLCPGGKIIVQGTTVSLDQRGTAAVIGGSSTQTLSYAHITGAPTPAFMFNGTSVVQDGSSDFIIGGQTLSKGGIVTVSGTPISFAAEGTDVVVGTSTQGLMGNNDIRNGNAGHAPGIQEFESGSNGHWKLHNWYLGAGAGCLVAWSFLGIN